MAKLTIIRGIPGSGKSTYAKNNYNCLILEQDMFFERDGKYKYDAEHIFDAIKWCRNMTISALKVGMDVCVVNTFVKCQHISVYAEIAQLYGAEFEVIRMGNDFGNIHNVPEDALKRMRDSLMVSQWPNEKIIRHEV